jgi:hypothetical protein
MKLTEHKPQTEPTGLQAAHATAQRSAAVVVNGPSCPAAFARWWAEYQEKTNKAVPAIADSLWKDGNDEF